MSANSSFFSSLDKEVTGTSVKAVRGSETSNDKDTDTLYTETESVGIFTGNNPYFFLFSFFLDTLSLRLLISDEEVSLLSQKWIED